MLWPDYYPTDGLDYATFMVEHKSEHWLRSRGLVPNLYIAHCIDQIRQYIMCAGDLTPIPVMHYDLLGGFGYVNSDVHHTCRNFDAIRAWTDGRHALTKGANPNLP